MDDSVKFDRYYNLTLRYLSYRPRSEKEVVDYLTDKLKSQKSSVRRTQDKQVKIEIQNEKSTDDLINQIITKLKEYKFIDDTDFTKFWIQQRTKFKPKPIWIIESELKQKGISKDVIDEVLLEFDERKSLDEESAKKLAEKKMDFYRGLDPKKRREKVMSFLLRKGFNYDIVKKVVR